MCSLLLKMQKLMLKKEIFELHFDNNKKYLNFGAWCFKFKFLLEIFLVLRIKPTASYFSFSHSGLQFFECCFCLNENRLTFSKPHPTTTGSSSKAIFFFATVFFKSTLQLQKQFFFYHHQLIFKARLQYYYQPPLARAMLQYFRKIFLRFLLLVMYTQSKHGLEYNF